MDEQKFKSMVDAYIPSPRDESLDVDEYYVLSENNIIQKGWISDIAFDSHGNIRYRLRNKKGVVHSWASDELGYVRKSHMYDNKQDCKSETHFAYDDWEELRKN